MSEAVAEAFEDAKALLAEGSSVVTTDIAGAQFVSRYHPRIVEQMPVDFGEMLPLASEAQP